MGGREAAGKRNLGDGVTPPPTYHPGLPEGELTLGQFLDEFVAYFMAIGMSREEVMYGERAAFADYVLAYEYKQVQTNQNLHLQGLYNNIAVSCALSAAFAEKGRKGTPYPTYPIAITETERKAEKRRNIEKTLAFVRGRKRNNA